MREEWSALAHAGGNIFATPEFLTLWWRRFGTGELYATACRGGDGRLVALVPLYRRGGVVSLVRFLGHRAGDELGPVALRDDLALAQDAVRRLLADAPWRWAVFVGEQLPGDEEWAEALGARVLSTDGNAVLSLEGETWESLMAGWSAKLRRDLRSDERKLAERHGLAFRLATRETLDADLDSLFALHRERWPKSAFGDREAFHREFATLALERGWLRLWFLELEGKPAACWHGFRFEGIESHYQVGRDPAWDKWGIGTLLSGHTIREAVADGIREYRFLRGNESYKYRFAKEDPGLVTIGLTRGVVGRAALAGAVAARGARQRLRARA